MGPRSEQIPQVAQWLAVQCRLPDRLQGASAPLLGPGGQYALHGWAEGPQSLEIKKIGKAIAAALDEQELPLDGHRMVVCLHEQTDYVPVHS